MWKEQIPKVGREGRVDAGQDGNEVIFERADGTFSAVLSMHVRRDKLRFCFPSEGDGLLVGCARLIVEDLKIYQKTLGHQPRHDGVVGSKAMAIALCWKYLLEDEVSIGMVGNHDILVTGAGPNWEAIRVVSVEPAEGHDGNNDKIRCHNGLRRGDRW